MYTFYTAIIIIYGIYGVPYKNKGSKMIEMKNRRGIFLTSIMGKIFEKVLIKEVEEELEMDKHQNGGMKGRSTKDNWLALMNIIDLNKQLGRETIVRGCRKVF